MDFIRPSSLIVLFLVFVCASSELDLLLYQSGHMLTNSSGSFFLSTVFHQPRCFFTSWTSYYREGTNLNYIFEGMAHPFLHLSINLERQNALTEPR